MGCERVPRPGAREMGVLVVGATGFLGGLVVRNLVDQGGHPRVLVRSDPSARLLRNAGADPVFGDLKDPRSLRAACEGVDVVVTTATAVGRGGTDTLESVDREGNRQLIAAARDAGVVQFVFTSILPASEESSIPLFRAKAHAEAQLSGSGLTYTILAPENFMESWVEAVVGRPVREGRRVVLVGEGRRKHAFVSARDVAAFATGAIGHPEAVDRRLPIGGPEALSWREVVATYERVLGREIPVEYVAPEVEASRRPQGMEDILAWMETFDSAVEMGEACRTFGVKPTTLEDYVRSRPT